MKRHAEKLSHFQCGFCAETEACGWWSIADAPEDRYNWFCPWCGKENIQGDYVLVDAAIHNIAGRGIIISVHQDNHKFNLKSLKGQIVVYYGEKYKVLDIESSSADHFVGLRVRKHEEVG